MTIDLGGPSTPWRHGLAASGTGLVPFWGCQASVSRLAPIPQQATTGANPPQVPRSKPSGAWKRKPGPCIQLEVPANPASSPGTVATPGLGALRGHGGFASEPRARPLELLDAATGTWFRSTLIFPAGRPGHRQIRGGGPLPLPRLALPCPVSFVSPAARRTGVVRIVGVRRPGWDSAREARC